MIGHHSYQSDLEAASEHILQLLEQSTKEVVGTTCILGSCHKYDPIPFQDTGLGMRLPATACSIDHIRYIGSYEGVTLEELLENF